MGFVTGVVALLPLLGMPSNPPGQCAVVDGTGRCLIAAADPGRPGGPQDPAGSRRPPSPARATPPRLDPVATPVLAGALVGRAAGRVPAPAGAAGAPAPAQAVLAQRAVSQLTLRPPSIELSSTRGAFVGVPLWLWIDRGPQTSGPTSAVATAGSSRVEATGRLVAVEWELGPSGARVTCTGPGTPWRGQPGASPDCGYVYRERSLPDRTGGPARWTITATSVWQVGWTGVTDGGPVAGQQTLRLSSTATIAVGEVQVLVAGGG
jgi:hypothetical protein